MFAYNQFNELIDGFHNVFKNLLRLTNCSGFLYENSSLTNTFSTPIKLSQLFVNNPQLTICANLLGLMLTNPQSNYIEEDSYINIRKRRNLYISFGTNGDEMFANNPLLTTCEGAFAKCTAVDTMHQNIFGGVNATRTTAGNAAQYSKALKSVAFCFHDCDVTTTLTDKLFANQPNLESVAGFVSGGIVNNTYSLCKNVTGDISQLSTMFVNNTKLTDVRRFFESTGVTGQIPNSMFANNTMLQNANSLFRNANELSGSFPVNLFEKCAALSTCSRLFQACTGITETIPGSGTDKTLYMFKCTASADNNFKSLTNVSYLFAECSNIHSEIPDNLFTYTPSVTTVCSVFKGCGTQADSTRGVTGNIPNNLLSSMTKLQDASYLFSGCWNLSPVDINGIKYSSPVTSEGSSTLFANNKLVSNVAGLFQSTNVYNIPFNLFDGVDKLTNVSYMFNKANRSEASIPGTLFNYCPNISTIECFAGETGSAYNTSYGMPVFPSGIFKEYDVNSLVGQKHIENVFCAFRNNNTATGDAVLFQNWKIQPTKIAGCYNMCNALNNFDSINIEYKQSA